MADKQKADYHNNPYVRSPIYGIRIQPGTKLEEKDVYASTRGTWEPCPCPGVILQDSEIIWVRPEINPGTGALGH